MGGMVDSREWFLFFFFFFFLKLSMTECGFVKSNLQKFQESGARASRFHVIRRAKQPSALVRAQWVRSFSPRQNKDVVCGIGSRNVSGKHFFLKSKTWGTFKLSYLGDVWIPARVPSPALLPSSHWEPIASLATARRALSRHVREAFWATLRCFDCPVCVQIAYICCSGKPETYHSVRR